MQIEQALQTEVALKISVVVPVFKCDVCLEELCARLDRTLKEITNRYEIILVDDRSPDNAWATIRRLQSESSAVHGIRLSRNYGQHIATTAGLAAARGDAVVVMDCDLQDPPELISSLHKTLRTGYDLVLARRVRRNSSAFRDFAARAYFNVLNSMIEEKIDGNVGSFSILSRKVVDAFLMFGERERHYLFVLRWLGFHAGVIDYEVLPRSHGKSSYSLRRLIRHAVDGVLFQSTAFLKWIAGLGLIFAFFGLGWAVLLIYRHYTSNPMPGWTSLAVLMLVCAGVTITSLGIVGLYIGKIFEQVKGRPLYVIDAIAERSDKW